MYEKIKAALMEVEPKVYYGIGRFQGRQEWDCIVFGKRRQRPSENRTSIQNKWFVAIVKEEYVPDGMEGKVIYAMKKIGMRLATDDIQYDYVEKSGETTVEICTMEFSKSGKACRR